MINGSIDSVLRGTGVYGALAATLKNMVIKQLEQREKPAHAKDESAVLMEMLNVSPPLGIKARQIVNAEKTTRVSFNCRFKSVFSPYRDKQIGNFFQPITIKPVTLIGMNYKHPND